MKVPLLDLKLQYASLKKELDEALIKVAESQYFILGPEVEKLEKSLASYLGVKHAVGVSSGTDALLLALMAIDIRPGDEVIVPTFSFFATAGVVSRINAVPVFTDIDPVTFNIDPADLERKITPRTMSHAPWVPALCGLPNPMVVWPMITLGRSFTSWAARMAFEPRRVWRRRARGDERR
ncbi:MAG: hypothetical protein B7Z63_06865 [Ignavibacteriae bacterium 37-53-5]|nr:MAG: hypothetical protein B7Z63_06865 [Ignavibacteriae bacterium 37-53-5]